MNADRMLKRLKGLTGVSGPMKKNNLVPPSGGTQHLTSDFANRIGYRKQKLEIDTDGDMITRINGIVDIEYIDIDRNGKEAAPLKVATAYYLGELVPPATSGQKGEWKCSLNITTYFSSARPNELPESLVKFGPGAFVTIAVQALFGTKFGLTVLGLGDYQLPEVAE